MTERAAMIGYNIHTIREAKGLSVIETCKRADISKQTLWGIENGHVNPKVSTVVSIATALEVPVGLFFEKKIKCTLLVKPDKQAI